MNSMKIGTYQMDTTFGLYLPEYTIPAPAVQTNFVKIIGRDGSVDLSNALGLHYDSRTWSLDFKCFDPTVNWHTLSSQVMNAIHGKRLNFEFDDDPNYFWTGRVSVQNYVSNHGTGTLKVTIVSDPFKYAKLSTIVTKTASTGTEYTGALVTFNTANAKINDLSVTMQPIQDLHGYDHPWPAGGGVNKYDKSADYYGQNKFWNSETGELNPNNNYYGSPKIPIAPSTQYARTSGTSANIFYDSNGDYLSTTSTGGTFTSPANAYYVTFNIANNVNHDTVQFEQGASLSTYSPYSNICPISGRTGVNVWRTAKNLLGGLTLGNAIVNAVNSPSSSHLGSDDNGDFVTIKAGSAVARKSFTSGCKFKDNTQYTLIFRLTRYIAGTAINGNLSIRYTDEQEDTVCFRATSNTDVVTVAKVSAPGKTIKNVETTYGGGTTYLYYNDSGIFEGALAAADFTPYTGNTYAVDWSTEAGTVYGGTLDVTNGVLTVDRAMVDLGTLDWNIYNTQFYAQLVDAKIPSYSEMPNAICSMFKTVKFASLLYNDNAFAINIGQSRVNIVASAYSTPAEFQTAMSGVQLCYELATPLTYQLSAQDIEALVGTNNVWSDGGNVTVAVVTPETLTNNGRAVVPTLTASADMVLKWGNYSASVQQGTSTIPQLILENGANLIYIIGTGSISFTWQEVSL